MKNSNVQVLGSKEAASIIGGNPFWIGVAVGLFARGVYDLVNGVYAGVLYQLDQPDIDWTPSKQNCE